MTSHEFFNSMWEMLIGRTDGPLAFRLLVQPAMATIFAVRAGQRDASARLTPYLSSFAAEPEGRRSLLRQGWKDVGNVFIVAIVLDILYELIVYRWVYPGQALLVPTALAIVPYLLIRGPITRFMRRLQRP